VQNVFEHLIKNRYINRKYIYSIGFEHTCDISFCHKIYLKIYLKVKNIYHKLIKININIYT